MLRRLVAIVGPTGAGKSAAALQLAQRLGGEIVNADSRQVYRGMDIGTAKPTPAERRLVRHHLYDTRDPRQSYSLAEYLADAREALEAIWARGNFPWLVGGTPQYVWALLENWQVPPIPPDPALRTALQEIAQLEGPASLHARLAAVDPTAAARIDPRNSRRIIRALEVYQKTGRPISEWQKKSPPDFEFLLFAIDIPRRELYARVDDRVERMFAAGLVDEVHSLLRAGVPPDAPAMSSIGYREVVAYLQARITLGEAIERTKHATHRLIRSQEQWFRRHDPRITWVRHADDIELQANIFTGVCTNTIRGERR